MHTHCGLSANSSTGCACKTFTTTKCESRLNKRSEVEESQEYCFSITHPDTEQTLRAPVWLKLSGATDTNQHIPDQLSDRHVTIPIPPSAQKLRHQNLLSI
ncbi:hypothetical protein ABG768_003022 [Culter alburnus]|uniref:Uncharacterized protein n=1 Tax=Culter alburnus TaxID=194366 RepID=A0AAW2A7K2_CULAL